MKALVGAFNQEKALVGAFSVIVKTGCGTDGALHSTTYEGRVRGEQHGQEVALARGDVAHQQQGHEAGPHTGEQERGPGAEPGGIRA